MVNASSPKGRDESFRDSIATVDKRGKRIWIHPKKVSGRFFNRRSLVGYSLLVLLLAGPFIRIQGEPLLMVNILERRFVLFGQTFWPQDIHLFVLGFITFIVFVALFTVAFGRLFCGWACPQTVFMELVYRRIEQWIEGDRNEQLALNKAPWGWVKLGKKTLKHVLFFAIAFIIGNVFLAYIVGSDELIRIVNGSVQDHVGGFVAMIGFSLVFYGVFAFMREQVCTTVCPYGRLQGVLLDRRSLVIAYDHVRGEPREKVRRGEDRAALGKGDCIDCKACVHVCPTGIDIRNGTQLECVNCTACIDACDHMMDSVGLRRGLIRYASEVEIAEKKPWRFTTRMKAYSVVLTLLIGVIAVLLATRSDVESTVLRNPGSLFQRQDDGRISNLYQYRVVNKTSREMPLRFEILDAKGDIRLVGRLQDLPGGESVEGALFIVLDPSEVDKHSMKVTIGVFSGDKLLEKVRTSFIGPVKHART